MKKSVKVVCFTMMLFFGLSVHAQYFGVRAGLGISNLITSNETNFTYGRLLSTHVGGTVDFDISDQFYLQSGITFFKKGGASFNNNFNLYYLELPATVRFDFAEIGSEGLFYARAGFYSGFLLAANADGFALDIGNRPGDDFNFFDFGIITGAGYGFNDNIDIGLSFEFGFLNVEPNRNNVSLSNGAISITANYRFGI